MPVNALGMTAAGRRGVRRLQAAAAVMLLMTGLAGQAQESSATAADPNLAHSTELVSVDRGGYSISGLVTYGAELGSVSHGIALFPGYPGIMKLRSDAGQIKFELGGNFLVRSRRHWLQPGILVVVVDAPSDQWSSFQQVFRESTRYGADVAALLEAVAGKYAVKDWTFVGTSEGTVSAFHAARMNPQLARRLILTASMFLASANGPALSGVKWSDLGAELLWVHHAADPCSYTSYRDAQEFARRSNKPLVTVRGGSAWRSNACDALTAHGFVGVERETVLAMRSWVQTGQVPADVQR